MLRLAAMIALLAACGDNLRPVFVDDYPTEVREAVCRRLVRCGEVESHDTCLAINLDFTVAFTASSLAAISAGMITYDALAARDCIDGLAAQSCDTSSESFRRGPDACRTFLAGAGRAGDRCAFDLECRSGHCDIPACDHACCTGTCVSDAPPLPGLDDSCVPTQLCARGLTCDPSTRRCAALLPQGASCTAVSSCNYGLLCIDQRCAAPPAPGQPCTTLCRDAGTICSQTAHTCVPAGVRGAACTIDSPTPDCSPVYPCDRSGHCSAGIPLGQLCELGDRCGDDTAICDIPIAQINGQCVLPKPDGSPCSRDAACSSLYCDPFTLRCAPEPLCF